MMSACDGERADLRGVGHWRHRIEGSVLTCERHAPTADRFIVGKDAGDLGAALDLAVNEP